MASADDPPPFSCGAQIRLPLNYPANFSLGIPSYDGPELTLDDLRDQGFDYAEYMKTDGGADGGALGAKFRNVTHVAYIK